ncbi:MAG: ABC transporter permease [Rhizobiales bacterium]|nr:ABC transporter permease [Hyphomicrobiales bacterium]MBA69002.1 ABC transporter permease [Hyphomicrobiales bacterium]|tara:strand:+ start:103 stop:1110 length:1008 start_codon:yes stop_codon:yes gene_type:complete
MSDLPRADDHPQDQTGQTRKRQAALRPMAPIVPPSNVSGRALITVIAIMAFLSCLTAGAVTMVRSTASAWQSQISRELTVQLKPVEGLEMDAALEEIRTAALSVAGVATASIIDRAATERLLSPWLGDDFDIDALPVPRLVILTIDEDSPPDYGTLRTSIANAVPQAALDDHRAWTDRLVAMARTMSLLGLGILALIMAATALTVIFATRGAMAGNRHIIEVLHFVGAETGFIARQFQRRFLFFGLKGAGIGGAAASFVFLFLAAWQAMTRATPLNDQATALFGRFLLPWSGYLWIVLVIAAIAAMTTLTSRLTVIHAVREIDQARANPGMVDFN